jgi:hypothetical protein
MHAWYGFSNRPGPKREWILYAALSTLFVMLPCTSVFPCFPFVSVTSVVAH